MAFPVPHRPSVHPSLERGGSDIELISMTRRQIDDRLDALLAPPGGGASQVTAAMRYGVLAPGKRLRPLLLVLSARALGAGADSVLDVACALEMVHAASLVLDDLPCMDDASTRRGQPAVHAAFGQDVAVLSAVALLTCAWRTTAMAKALPAAMRNDMVAALSDAVGVEGLVTGQYRDLHFNGDALSASGTARINDQKTGALFAAAFELAGLATGSSPRVREVLQRAGSELGQAFQVADDLADTDADMQAIGTKPTLVALLGATAARGKVREHTMRAQDLLATAMPSDTAVFALIDHVFGAL